MEQFFDEIENMEFDQIKEYIESDKCKMLNPRRIRDIMMAYRTLLKAIEFDMEDVEVEIAEGALQLGDIAIRILMPQLTTYNPKTFAAAISRADNVDIYPTTDDRVRVDIQFQNAYFVERL